MLKEGLQAYLLQRLMPRVSARAGSSAVSGHARRRRSTGAGSGDRRFHAGQVGRFRVSAPAGRQLARGRVSQAESPERLLSVLLTLAGAACVREVRVRGRVVHA